MRPGDQCFFGKDAMLQGVQLKQFVPCIHINNANLDNAMIKIMSILTVLPVLTLEIIPLE
jgi:hypothetical protein